MANDNSGFKGLLALPVLYDAFQNAMGAANVRKFVSSMIDVTKSSIKILDVGCGTGEIIEYLPNNISYVGVDLSETYIEAARKRYISEEFSDRDISFHCVLVQDFDFTKMEGVDYVFCFGLLHHLNDPAVLQLVDNVYSNLNYGGKLISIDPCYITKQNWISKLIITNDRGQNVRTGEEYKSLVSSRFKEVSVIHRNDLLRLPYDHVVLQCQRVSE